MKKLTFKILSKSLMTCFRVMSFLPVIGGFGKSMYASCLFGEASGLYFGRHYSSAIKAYEKAISYSQGLEDTMGFPVCFEQAYESMGVMYEKGLGVEKDELKAEEYYLRAGTRGSSAVLHSVATRSYNEKFK